MVNTMISFQLSNTVLCDPVLYLQSYIAVLESLRDDVVD